MKSREPDTTAISAVIDHLCDEFESQLKAGKEPRIEDYLPRVAKTHELPLLRELLMLELELRKEHSGFAAYQQRFAEYADSIRDIFDPPQSDAVTSLSEVPKSPRQLGRYKLLQLIGEGGMGAVWMAEQREPVRRRVAIKLIKSNLADTQFSIRFEAERQALAMMSHQNIAKVFDAGSAEDGTPYFVMELVQGMPITEYCDANALTIRERLELFIPVCSAVHHAHQKGIIHRDLKPNNVLVASYEGKPVSKVIDFGLAKTLQPEMRLTDETMFTQFGQVVGTVQYMSPEQANLDGMAIDTRSDVYSLGVMLYELLAGSTPIERETVKELQLLQVLDTIRKHDPPRPSHRLSSSVERLQTISQQRGTPPDKLRRLLRSDLDWIVMKAIEAEPKRRYDSAANFGEDIQRYLDGQPINAHPPSTLYSIRKFLVKHSAIVSTAALLAMMLVAATVVSTWFALDANEKRQAANLAKTAAQTSEKAANSAKEDALAAKARSDYFVTNARWNQNRVRESIERLQNIPEPYRNFEWNLDRRLYEGCDGYLYGHQSRIRSIEFCKNRPLVVSASSDHTVRVWNPLTHQEVHRLEHDQPVYDAAVSVDGDLVATIDARRAVRVWNLEKQTVVHTLLASDWSGVLGHSDFCSLDFSYDSNQLVIAATDPIVLIWDLRQNKTSSLVHDSNIFAATFDADASSIAVVGDHGIMQLHNLKDDERVTLQGGEDAVVSVDYSPDGRLVASAGDDRNVRIWDVGSGALLGTFRGHKATVLDIEFSPDSLRLVSGSQDESIRIWDVASGQAVFKLNADNWVRGVSFSQNGSRLVSASARAGQVWDATSGTNIRTLRGHSASVTAVKISADGRRLAISSKDHIASVWQLSTGERLATLNHDDQINDLAIDVAGTQLLAAADDGSIHLWDIEKEKLVVADDEKFFQKRSRTLSVAISPTDDHFAKGLADGTVQLWNPRIRAMRTLHHGGEVRSVDFSPDGSKLATASSDNTIKVWESVTGELLMTLGGAGRGHSKGVHKARFSPDGTMLASASQDDTVRIWDVATGQALCRPIQATRGPDFYDVSFHPTGTRLAAGSGDGLIHIWDISKVREGIFEEVRSIPGHSQERQLGNLRKRSVRAVTFSPDGNLLATGSDFANVRLWDGSPYRESVILHGHHDAVKAFAFDSSAKQILTGSSDKTVRLWKAENGKLIRTYLGHSMQVNKVAFSKDETTIFSRDVDGNEIAWDVATGERVELNDPTRWDPVQTTKGQPDVVLDDHRVVLPLQSEKKLLYFEFKNQTDRAWHQRMASVAETNGNEFASLFHKAWAIVASDSAQDRGGNSPRPKDLELLRSDFAGWRQASKFADEFEPIRLFPASIRQVLASVEHASDIENTPTRRQADVDANESRR